MTARPQVDGSCCNGTGLADYAAVPCPNPHCPVAPSQPTFRRRVQVTMALDIEDRAGKAVISDRNGEIGSCDRQAFLDAIAETFSVLILPADPAEKHVIEFRADSWTIQHTAACRASGNLFDCPVNRAAQTTLDGGAAGLGRFEIEHNNGHLIIGARIDTPTEG